MRIVVLAGGLSPERDVSLSSGSLIANTLMETGHEVLLLDVYEGLKLNNKDYGSLFIKQEDGRKYDYTIAEDEPDLDKIKKDNNNQEAFIGDNVLDICKYADVVFMALHGAMGENGQLQATFDNFGIKYTGSGYIGSLLAMDKDITKKLLRQAHISTADWITCSISPADITLAVETIIDILKFPCVIKPCSCGSSVGVSMVQNESELKAALSYAAKYESSVMAEKMIKGREFSIGILDGAALPVIEIIPNEGFYDYKNKYQKDLTKEICPAPLSKELTKKVQELALLVHQTLRLGDYSRIDFILDEEGEFICLEANTLPGMTPTSLIPQEALVAGISYRELCEKIALLPFIMQ